MVRHSQLYRDVNAIKGYACGCYIGETESLGRPVVRFCSVHENAVAMLKVLLNFISGVESQLQIYNSKSGRTGKLTRLLDNLDVLVARVNAEIK